MAQFISEPYRKNYKMIIIYIIFMQTKNIIKNYKLNEN